MKKKKNKGLKYCEINNIFVIFVNMDASLCTIRLTLYHRIIVLLCLFLLSKFESEFYKELLSPNIPAKDNQMARSTFLLVFVLNIYFLFERGTMSTLQYTFLSSSGCVPVKCMNETISVWLFLSCAFSASFSSACKTIGTWWSLGQAVPFFSWGSVLEP